MKKILSIAFVMVLLISFLPAQEVFAGTGISTGFSIKAGPLTIPLIAGQFIQVGTVTISGTSASITIRYEITEPGWYLTSVHAYVGKFEPRSSAPGLFPYKYEGLHDTVKEFTVSPQPQASQYYIAVHATVSNENIIIGWDCPSLAEVEATLPAGGTIQRFTDPSPFVTITDAGAFDGDYPAWCIDRGHGIDVGLEYPAKFYSSYQPVPQYLIDGGFIDHPENLDLVNWIVNHSDGYDFWDVSLAIWHLITDDNPLPPTPAAQELIDGALAGGEGFLPDFSAGDMFTFIIAPYPDAPIGEIFQALLAGFEVPCTPLYGSETAWGEAPGHIHWKTGWGSYFLYTP